jgi:hypothetical protein
MMGGGRQSSGASGSAAWQVVAGVGLWHLGIAGCSAGPVWLTMLCLCRIFAATAILSVMVGTVLGALVAESSAQSLGDLSVKQICRAALTRSQNEWEQRPEYSEYVAEATPTSSADSAQTSAGPVVVLMIFFPLLALGLGLAWLFTRPIEAKALDGATAGPRSDRKTDTPMPKFFITRDGRSVEVEARDEAAARAMSDYKTDVVATTRAENLSRTTSWWYVSNNQRKGPIGDEELHRLLIDGTLNSNSLVWKQDMEGWQPARQIDELSTLLSSLPPEIPRRPEKTRATLEATSVMKAVVRFVAGTVVALFTLWGLGSFYYAITSHPFSGDQAAAGAAFIVAAIVIYKFAFSDRKWGRNDARETKEYLANLPPKVKQDIIDNAPPDVKQRVADAINKNQSDIGETQLPVFGEPIIPKASPDPLLGW